MLRIGLTRGRPQSHACARIASLWLEQLEDRVLLSGNTIAGLPLTSTFTPIQVAQGQEDFTIVLSQPGNLNAEVNDVGVSLALSEILDTNGAPQGAGGQGVPIAQSNGQSSQAGPLIAQGLSAGTYILAATNLAHPGAGFTLEAEFAPSNSTLNTVNLGTQANVVVSGNFGNLVNSQSVQDLAVAGANDTITILWSNGDGTFQVSQIIPVDGDPQALVVGDFGNGQLDLAASNFSSDVTILLGNGDGTFQAPVTIAGVNGNSLAAADFNGNGHDDLAVGNSLTNSVTILQLDASANGNVTSSIGAPVTVPNTPIALVAADFTGAGLPDLAVAERNASPGAVAILVNQGGGVFQNTASFNVGKTPVALAAGAFSGDGNIDLAVADLGSGDVTILQGDGHASFTVAQTIPLGTDPAAIVAADFNNGEIDLATANPFSNNVTVLLGDGAGGFHVAGSFPAGVDPGSLTASDFNGDGNIDLAVADSDGQGVTILLGQGGGVFPRINTLNATGFDPDAIVQGDFTGDGRLDVAVTNFDFGTVTILLGQNDGTFETAGTYQVGADPVGIVAGDFNGDGRLDLAIADFGSDDVTVLLGKGDGAFLPGPVIQLDGKPSAIVAGDFDGTGNLDLAVALEFNAGGQDNQVEILPGDGHGNFGAAVPFTVGYEPVALVAGDFTGDGKLDLAVADYTDQTVALLLGAGGTFADGSFAFEPASFLSMPIGPSGAPIGNPNTLVAGDFTGDGRLDLAVGIQNAMYDNIGLAVFINDPEIIGGEIVPFPDPPVTYNLNGSVKSLVTGEFTGDGHLDLAAANFYTTSYAQATGVTVLLGTGTGAFGSPIPVSLSDHTDAITVGAFTGDGNLDIVAAGKYTDQVITILGDGQGDFSVPPIVAPNPVASTPLIAPLLGSELDDVNLNQNGAILLRRGLADEPGAFAAPIVLNPDPGDAARALALVQTGAGNTLVAALDADSFAVTLYQPNSDGTVTTLPAGFVLPAGYTGATIAAADLTNDGRDDLVISAADSDQIFVVLQTSPGVFGTPQPCSVGMIPSAIAFTDVNGDGFLDIVVSDRFSGQVSVLINQQNGLFDNEERFDAGPGLFGVTSINGATAVQSYLQTVGVVAVGPDLVALNAATQSFTVLTGDGFGGFLNPQPGQTYATPGTPTAIVAADFTGNGVLDLAVLCADTDTISIYFGDGRGGFGPTPFTIDAGNDPTGLSVADVTRPGGGGPDGIPDLLVGNAYGDLLILTGSGNGSFAQYVRADQQVGLAVAPGAGAQPAAFYFSDAANDQLAYVSAVPGAATVAGTSVFENRNSSTGIQAPGAEQIVNVDGTSYLVVVNSGANQLLVFTLGPDGSPVPASEQVYFTGTDPVGLTVTSAADDLTGDGLPDVVVANYGSNDVSVFIGQLSGGVWTLSARARQSSGGIGPTAVAVGEVTGSGMPDLLVANSASNTVNVLAGRGDGFFVTTPEFFETGADPEELFLGNFGAGLDLISVNAGSNNVTLIADLLNKPTAFTISSGGTDPDAAVLTQVNGANLLLVANAGNGVLEMLSVNAQGLEPVASFSQPGAVQLSDFALVAAGNQLDIYGTVAGRDLAVLMGTFGLDANPLASLPPSPGFPAGVEFVFITNVPGNLANADVAFTFFLAPGANADFVAPVQVAFNAQGNPFPNGIANDGINFGLRTAEEDRRQRASADPAGILLLNLYDLPAPGPVQNIFEPREEEEELLEELAVNAEQAPAVAAPDVTVPPISLRRTDAQPVERIVIQLEPRLRVEAIEAPRTPKSALVGVLAMPVLMSQLAERLRPSLAGVRVALSKMLRRKPSHP
jgi:hypothetical protein